jgi:hypothetical protein
MDVATPSVERSGLSRRDLLKRGAVVGAGVVWITPLVQVVSLTPAHADSPSAPRVPPTQKPPPNPPPTSAQPSTPASSSATPSSAPPSSATPSSATPQPSSPHSTPATSSSHATPTPASSSTHQATTQGATSASGGGGGGTTSSPPALAFTGVDQPIGPTVAFGATAVALGAGLLAASKARKPRTEAAGDVEGESPPS